MLEKLVAEFPLVRAYCYALVQNYGRFTVLLHSTARVAEAEKVARRMAALADGLVADAPDADHYRYQWAASRLALADALARRGRPKEAEPAYRQAIDASERLARKFPKNERYQERVAHCSKRFGILLGATGRPNEAKAAYRRTLELNPDDAQACNNLAWLLASPEDLARADPAQAVTLAERAVKLAPRNVIDWNTLGGARYRAGRWNAAREALEKSLELHPENNPYDWLFLAMTAWQLGERAEALRRYKQAVEWLDQQKSPDAELGRLRKEAAALLKQ